MFKRSIQSLRSMKYPVTVPGWAFWSFAFACPLALVIALIGFVTITVLRGTSTIHFLALASKQGVLQQPGAVELAKDMFVGGDAMYFYMACIVAVCVMQFCVVQFSRSRMPASEAPKA